MVVGWEPERAREWLSGGVGPSTSFRIAMQASSLNPCEGDLLPARVCPEELSWR